MLSFQEFFTACTGLWRTERIYHDLEKPEIERSYTEFRVNALMIPEKRQILGVAKTLPVERDIQVEDESLLPGFAIAFDTRSETGATVSMSLKALFVPDAGSFSPPTHPLPLAAQIPLEPESETIQGYYLRDQGYSETGAIAGRFTYQPTRQTLEMITYYKQSVAVDQMRLVAPQIRLRTILTYQRPTDPQTPPSRITLIGFGVEHRQSD